MELFKKQQEQLSDTVDNILGERMRNPLIASFFIAFIITNWRIIIYVCFSYSSADDLIQLIEKELSFCTTFLFPTIFAFVYTYILPRLNLIFERWNRNIMIERSKVTFQIREENAKNATEAVIAEIELKRKDVDFSKLQEELAERNQRIKELEENTNPLLQYNDDLKG